MQVPIELIKDAACQIAREDFYSFCKLLHPKFYTESRTHLKVLCNTLQDFCEDRILDSDGIPKKNLMILMAPRHGKSFTVQNLCKFLFGKDKSNSVVTASYNQTLSMRAGKEVRNAIMERSIDGGRLTYSDIFPGVNVRPGDGAMDVWALEGSYFSYLSTSPTGTLTGIGTKWLIIDDLCRSAYEANNKAILEGHWDWYTDTALSRVEHGGKKVIINTRWANDDLSGRILALEPDKWHVVKMPACLNEDKKEMLCDSILTFDEYADRKKKTDRSIFMANYQQEITEVQDRLYSQGFGTYTERPQFTQICNVTDTADEGQDFLASIVYGVHDNKAYVLDVIYTQEPMEVTESALAKMLNAHRVDKSWTESNNGGRGFARNVERILRENGNHHTVIEWYHQSENKWARILTNAASCQNSILFPFGWEYRWPEFKDALISLGRTDKPLHDDAPDALTAVVEKSLANADFKFWI